MNFECLGQFEFSYPKKFKTMQTSIPGLPLCQECHEMSGSFYDVLNEDIPYFMFSVQYEKNLNVK